MTPIRIHPALAAELEHQLLAVNGKSTAHTFTVAQDLGILVRDAKAAMTAAGAPDDIVGTIFTAQSGEELPPAYKFGVKITLVSIQRHEAGWFLVAAESDLLHPCQVPMRKLHLPEID